MELPLALATYFICWWLALFMVLPFGVKTQQEEGEVVPGSVESAPFNPHIWKKLLATTLLGAVLFAVVYIVITTDIIQIDQIPFLPNFEKVK